MNSDEREAVGQARRVIEKVLDRGEKSTRRHPPVEPETAAQILGHLHSVRAHLSAAVRCPQPEAVQDKEGVWSNNGRRVVVIEQGAEGFVQVGSEVVKVLVAPKPPTEKQKKAAFLRNMDKRFRGPRMSAKTEAKMWKQYWAEQDRVQAVR